MVARYKVSPTPAILTISRSRQNIFRKSLQLKTFACQRRGFQFCLFCGTDAWQRVWCSNALLINLTYDPLWYFSWKWRAKPIINMTAKTPSSAPAIENNTAVKAAGVDLLASNDAVFLVTLLQIWVRTISSCKTQSESEFVHSLLCKNQLMAIARQMPSTNQATWAHLRSRRRVSIARKYWGFTKPKGHVFLSYDSCSQHRSFMSAKKQFCP